MKPMVREYIQTALFCGLMYITSAAAGQSPAPNADTTSELIRQIGSDNNVVRQSAFNALVSKGESALPDVFAALKDTTLDAANQRIRPRIPVLLRRFGAPQKPIADALISALGDDNPAVRSSARPRHALSVNLSWPHKLPCPRLRQRSAIRNSLSEVLRRLRWPTSVTGPSPQFRR